MSVAREIVRITQVCDTCHKRGRRCRRAGEDNISPCLTCRDAGLVCTRNRRAARRGPKIGSGQHAVLASSSRDHEEVHRHEVEPLWTTLPFDYVRLL